MAEVSWLSDYVSATSGRPTGSAPAPPRHAARAVGHGRAGHRRPAGHRPRGRRAVAGRSRRCAPRPTPRRSSPRRAARPARPRRSAPAARSRPSAWSTRCPTTSASASGAACPSVSVAGCAAAPSDKDPHPAVRPAGPLRTHSRRRSPSAAVVVFGRVLTRVAVGRAPVVREVRAAGPLMAALRGAGHRPRPVADRGAQRRAPRRRPRGRPGRGRGRAARAGPPGGRRVPARSAVAGRSPTVTLLGDGTGPLPGGRPPARLLARDDERRRPAGRRHRRPAGHACAARGPCAWPACRWATRPLRAPGRPAARRPSLANVRSRRLVDELDDVGAVVRSRDPAVLERWLPALLARVPDRRARRLPARRRPAARGDRPAGGRRGGRRRRRRRRRCSPCVDGRPTGGRGGGRSDVGGLRTRARVRRWCALTVPRAAGWPRRGQRARRSRQHVDAGRHRCRWSPRGPSPELQHARSAGSQPSGRPVRRPRR